MSKPSKVPIIYISSILNSSNRGYEYRPDNVEYDELRQLAVNDGELVPVSKVKKFFKNDRAFKEFKENISVPDKFWKEVIKSSPVIRKYAKRFMSKVPSVKGRPRVKRQSRKYRSKLGTFSDEELSDIDSDTSVISIIPSNDECDETDVNVPLPSCSGIRRVCREYDSSRRYLPYKRDSSENKRYRFQISYNNNNT